MTGSDGAEREIWGTREELLLAGAVSRHGTRSWDSVAMEVRARMPSPPLLTAQTCKRRYRDLRRRFTAVGSRGIDGGGGDAIPLLLEELRRLRVAELRREVERYDVSIMSLQLKVKRLQEDRERSREEEEQSGDVRSDLPETGAVKEETSIPGGSPVNFAVNGIRSGSSGRSCNESNSSEAKGSRGPEDGELGGLTVREENGVDEIDSAPRDDEKVAGEGSYNGSSETVAKGAEVATSAKEPAAAPDPVRRLEAGESGESVAESKGETAKESSDVQSSASLARRPRRDRRKAFSVGSSGGDEADADAEADEVSPLCLTGVARSRPLASFLEIVRSHKYGSMFEHRLESQDGARYRSLIRQHVDLAMVHGKLAEAAYATDAEFYRDLLLLFTNATVFFPRNSTEHLAAVKLRQLVRKQVAVAFPKPTAPSSPVAAEDPETRRPPAAPLPPPAPAPKPETDPDPPGRTSSATPPLVACRKRSSIAGKAASRVAADAEEEEKPGTEKKDPEGTEKKRTKERSVVAGSKGLRTSKIRGSGAGDTGGAVKNATAEDVSDSGNAETKHNGANAAVPTASVAKKRSAVNFLTRMKRGPSAGPKGTLLERLKTSGRDRGGEQRKGRDHGVRQASPASSGKQAQEQCAPLKRVGRPPKRPPPQLTPPPAKRTREAEAAAPPPRRAVAVKRRGRK